MESKFNIHLHTNYSDGRSQMRSYVERYIETGYNCLITSDHDYKMDRDKYIAQCLEAEDIMKEQMEKQKFPYCPIINCLEISLGFEEAILINKMMCMDWFRVKNEIHGECIEGRDEKLQEWLSLYNKEDYSIVLVHPGYCFDRMFCRYAPGVYKIFDAYEVGNCGSWIWRQEPNRQILKDVMPQAREIAGLDAHSTGYVNDPVLGLTHNTIEVEIKTEKDLINLIKYGNYKVNEGANNG